MSGHAMHLGSVVTTKALNMWIFQSSVINEQSIPKSLFLFVIENSKQIQKGRVLNKKLQVRKVPVNTLCSLF